MKYVIEWTEYAYQDFERIGEWLMWKWGLNSVRKFKHEVDFILSLLREKPNSFQTSKINPTFRRTLVNKHTSLFFRIDGTSVTLIAFWNHTQDPKKLRDFLDPNNPS